MKPFTIDFLDRRGVPVGDDDLKTVRKWILEEVQAQTPTEVEDIATIYSYDE
jgi:hypothetical protein